MSSSLTRPRDLLAHSHRRASENAGRSWSRRVSWKPCCDAHTRQCSSSSGVRMIVLPATRGSRRQITHNRLRSKRISARWMRSKLPDRYAAASRVCLDLGLLLWRKHVDRPRILAALQGSPDRVIAVQVGMSRFGPSQNRARPIMKLRRCASL